MKKSQKLKYLSCFLAATSLVFSCSNVFSSTTPPCSVKSISPDQSTRKSTIIPMRLLPPEKQMEIRKQSSVLILFARHGTTPSNFKEQTHPTGSEDTISAGLTTSETIRNFSGLCKYLTSKRVFTGTDPRCMMTVAVLLAEDSSLEGKSIEQLREQNFGELAGKDYKEYLKNPGFFNLLSKEDYQMPGGESRKEVTNRILISIEKGLRDILAGNTTFFCSNRGSMVSLEMFISGIKFDIPQDTLPDQATIDKIIKLYHKPNYSMFILRYFPSSQVIGFLEENWYNEISGIVKQESVLHTPENNLYSPGEALLILERLEQFKLFQRAQLLMDNISLLPSPASSPVTEDLSQDSEKEAVADSSTMTPMTPKSSISAVPSSPLQRSFSAQDLGNIRMIPQSSMPQPTIPHSSSRASLRLNPSHSLGVDHSIGSTSLNLNPLNDALNQDDFSEEGFTAAPDSSPKHRRSGIPSSPLQSSISRSSSRASLPKTMHSRHSSVESNSEAFPSSASSPVSAVSQSQRGASYSS